MQDHFFSNFTLEENTEYFLYIGELKNYGINLFLRDALSRIFNRRFEFISIVPDVFEQYNYDNLIVINPNINSLACLYGPNVSCRVSAGDFLKAVSESNKVHALIQRLLNRQQNVYIYMYESLPEMTLDTIPGVNILGPDRQVSHQVNSKLFQYRELQELLPLAEFKICHGLEELQRFADSSWSLWQDGLFVTREYSAAGVNSIVARDWETIRCKFVGQDETYLVSRYIPHTSDPTVIAVVASEDDIFIAGVADQNIVGGNRFTGSTFPTRLPDGIVAELRRQTVVAGQWLARQGYRGIFGCDFLVDDNQQVFFLEINARKQGTTLEFCCTMEQSLPPGTPNLPELEFYAVEKSILPLNSMEMRGNPKQLYWGTFNYKLDRMVRTNGYIPQSNQERDAFRRVASGNLKKDFLILEHSGSDFVIANGAFLARIVALGHDHESVQQGLIQATKTIELTIAEIMEEDHASG